MPLLPPLLLKETRFPCIVTCKTWFTCYTYHDHMDALAPGEELAPVYFGLSGLFSSAQWGSYAMSGLACCLNCGSWWCSLLNHDLQPRSVLWLYSRSWLSRRDLKHDHWQVGEDGRAKRVRHCLFAFTHLCFPVWWACNSLSPWARKQKDSFLPVSLDSSVG